MALGVAVVVCFQLCGHSAARRRITGNRILPGDCLLRGETLGNTADVAHGRCLRGAFSYAIHSMGDTQLEYFSRDSAVGSPLRHGPGRRYEPWLQSLDENCLRRPHLYMGNLLECEQRPDAVRKFAVSRLRFASSA